MPPAKPFTYKHLARRTKEISELAHSRISAEFRNSPIECAEDALHDLTASKKHAQNLVNLLNEMMFAYQVIRRIPPGFGQPDVNGIQSTPGEIVSTLKPLQKFITEVLKQYPPDVFSLITVPIQSKNETHIFSFIDIMQALNKELKQVCELNEKDVTRGGQKKNKDAASHVAAELCVFADDVAPKATKKQKKAFIAACLDLIGVDFPSPENHADDFNKMFKQASGPYAFMVRSKK